MIATDAGIQLTGSQPRAPDQRPEPKGGLSFGGIIVIVVVILIILFTPLRSILFWICSPISSAEAGAVLVVEEAASEDSVAAEVVVEALAASVVAVRVAAAPAAVGSERGLKWFLTTRSTSL